MREDGVEYIKVEKCTLIQNTANDPIESATPGTTISQANEDNTRNMTKTMNDLRKITK